ncbi:hypothetical protein SERLADRAFT_457745 [Serpula lacrymans var. lacrymans S7.9]|uniref:Uncharacterized protein n=1 Tax=Serpula lacrymans var. lacrymans (strain S7.9) TaxID=578457 RepID=F8NH86_SERL9|nr:uncharacterized protein SERLADRAFT_457745 [Serpula lacrymans var. lacrymans S7.9]EGO29675.1 hypothetical protein SERLADRAFT_457745 [Serpula lacrymans var. lacrymans S7.9]
MALKSWSSSCQSNGERNEEGKKKKKATSIPNPMKCLLLRLEEVISLWLALRASSRILSIQR